MAKKEVYYKGQTFVLSYELAHFDAPQSILFLHGWGSSKEAMKSAFSKTFPEYRHIYVDLPGFGHSSIPMILDTQAYADIISLFLEQMHTQPVMVFGHSFGGKVATLLNPKTLVLLSSAGILAPKSLNVKMKIWLFKRLKYFLPKRFYKLFATKDVDGMSQMMYEILKKVVNEDFSSLFMQRKQSTYLFWGKTDTATPLQSGEKMHQLIENSYFYPLEGDHFFFLKQGKNIERIMREQMQ